MDLLVKEHRENLTTETWLTTKLIKRQIDKETDLLVEFCVNSTNWTMRSVHKQEYRQKGKRQESRDLENQCWVFLKSILEELHIASLLHSKRWENVLEKSGSLKQKECALYVRAKQHAWSASNHTISIRAPARSSVSSACVNRSISRQPPTATSAATISNSPGNVLTRQKRLRAPWFVITHKVKIK
jgi:hypothetical protein